jgi:multidrug resistance efflux pump
MLKILIFLLLFISSLLSKVHYAKVEPYNSVVIKSAVSARVLYVDLEAEGKMIGDREVIHLDDIVDKADLNSSNQSLKILKNSLKINRDMLSNLNKSLKRQKGYYNRLNRLSTASTTQKDTAFNSFVSAQNQYISTQDKVESIKRQILDMKLKITKLKDIISKKSIQLQDKYLYKLSVRVGDYVNPNSPLLTSQDQTKAKLIIFLEPSELDNINSKRIYIDNNQTDYVLNKIWNSTDEKYISLYRAEIYIDRPKDIFSNLVKIEIK